MTTTRPRIGLFGLDDDYDEELPGYEASTAPAYEGETWDHPIVSYRLRQYDRKIQLLVGHGPSSSDSYRITSNSFRIFSKKPDMEVVYTSHAMRQRSLATIAFDSDGPLPWRPRAHFDHVSEDGKRQRYPMESANFADWTFSIANRTFSWALNMRPVSLVLTEADASEVIARFTYSAVGMAAARGGEVGELSIYRDALTAEQEGVDKAVCGLMVALKHLKKMGRHYSNEPTTDSRRDSAATRGTGTTQETGPLHRTW